MVRLLVEEIAVWSTALNEAYRGGIQNNLTDVYFSKHFVKKKLIF